MNDRPNAAAPDSSFEFEALQHARNYRRALIAEFGEYLRGTVVEVGAGVGQITELLCRQAGVERVIAVEPDAEFCRNLRRRLPEVSVLQGTVFALGDRSECDAIVSVNVLEHIQDDRNELNQYARLLRPQRGCVCLFVPARREIYAPLDRDFGHFRRYAKAELREKLEAAGFRLERLCYFNLVGYFAWWFSFCLLKNRKFEPGAVRLFDRVLFPPQHWWESRICRPPIGQSLLAIGRMSG